MGNFNKIKAKICPCGKGFIPKIGQKHCSSFCKTKYGDVIEDNPKKGKPRISSTKTSFNGYVYHSALEANYAQKLDLRIKAKDVKSWTRQHKFELYVAGIKICNYYIDFRVELFDGSIEYVEVKGFETQLWQLKWNLTKALFNKLTEGENAKLLLVKKV